MRLIDFIARIDKNVYLDVQASNGDLVYFGKASNYLFDEKDNSYFVDYFEVHYFGNGQLMVEVRVVC